MLMKHIVLSGLRIVAGLALLGFILGGLFLVRFVPLPPFEDPLPADATQAEKNLADIEQLAGYAKRDWSMRALEPPVIEAALSDMRARAGEMDAAEFEVAVARFAALADNAHTSLPPTARLARLNRAPVIFERFRDGVFVVAAQKQAANLLGLRLVAIDGKPLADIEAALRPLHGGPENYARSYQIVDLRNPMLLHALGVAERPDGYRLTLETPDGEPIEETLEALSPAAGYWDRPWRDDILRPDERLFEAGWYLALAADVDTPPSLRAPDGRPHYSQPLQDGRGLYVRYDVGGGIDEFLNSTLGGIMPDTEFAVIDLRWHRGGSAAIDFVKAFTDALPVKARLYIITSAYTFSAGIMDAALFKHYGGKRAEVIGTPVGDRLAFWSNGGLPMRLGNSGIELRTWSGYEDWKDGCTDWRICYWPHMTGGVGVGALVPDIRVANSFSDWQNGRDTVLETVLALESGGEQTF